MNEECIVMTTTENDDQAMNIINRVLEEKLAACIQTREINSHYIWNGQICHEAEILIWFKTEKRLIVELEELIKKIHPYDIPEIISVPIEKASKEYGEWMHSILK